MWHISRFIILFFSPVVLLVGSDENNQTDLVVVGKNKNNSEAAEILGDDYQTTLVRLKHFNLEKFIQSFVIGEKISTKSPVEENRSVDSTPRHHAQLDISQGAEELNHNLEDYQYFDSDFDQLLTSSHQVLIQFCNYSIKSHPKCSGG